MASKKSKVWRFFTISTADEHKAICNLCTAEVSRGGSRAKTYTTTNLQTHLSTHHEQFVELERLERCTATQEASASSQPSLVDVFERSKPYASNHPRAVEITHRIGEMVAVDNEPFYLVEQGTFQREVNMHGTS